MADHLFVAVPFRYTCTAVPARTHSVRPLSAWVMVIRAIGGAALPQEAVPGSPGTGDGIGAAEVGDDDEGEPEEAASGGPAEVPACCRPQPETSTAAPRATAARTGMLRMADSFRCNFHPFGA
jgi:hypothetical protein